MTNQFPGNAIAAVNSAQQAVNSTQTLTQTLLGYSGDSNGLPYTNIISNKQGTINRNIITWFIPQFGTVRMYVNPQNITYGDKKLISKERTKGGYTLQYWGEELTTINISGTTGSSGFEGINVLHEIYRAEQYAFDAVALTMSGNNAAADITNNILNGVGGTLGNSVNQLFSGNSSSPNSSAGLLGGIMGLSSPGASLAPQNIPSLAALAFSVQLYYNGWIFTGYFDSMNVRERADSFQVEYDMVFFATKRSGYRVNQFPWQRSANNGPSNYNTPLSFNGEV